MFNKLKQIKDLRSQAKTMQDALAGESVTAEKSGVTIEMNGNMQVTSVKIAEGTSTSDAEKAVKTVINDAIKQTQKLMAKKIKKYYEQL